MTRRLTPHSVERRKDEVQLLAFRCWDQGWSASDIASLKEVNTTRNAVIGWIQRLYAADPEALQRKPEKRA